MEHPFLKPRNMSDREEHQRRAAFHRFDSMVSDALNDLKSEQFPAAYYVHRVENGEWYLSPPPHSTRISPVRIRLRFNASADPVGFQVTNYTAWTQPADCDLSGSALQSALERLFKKREPPPETSADDSSEENGYDWVSELVG
jgi:hypothetical protein